MEGEMDVREITPQELREHNEKSWKKTQKLFRRRLRKIAAGGENKAKYKMRDYCCGERIQPWLENLGFTCEEIGYGGWVEISWPEEEDVLERLRDETAKILTRPIKFTWRVRLERGETATWTKDIVQWDYVCSACGKHSEYKTDFCCNCGAKMHIEEGENGT